MTDQKKTYRPTRLMWCRTTNGYADADRCTGAEHDHYDLAVDEDTGKALYRIDPDGTTYLLPNGDMLRLTFHQDEPFIDPPITERIIPTYDVWTASGGAARGVQALDNGGGSVWDGDRLQPGVVRIVPVASERPAVGSLYVRPNGEVWRLRDYAPDWLRDGGEPHVQWAIQYPSGSNSSTSGADALPEDARLVWAP